MSEISLLVDASGRVEIPAQVLAEAGVHPGDELIVSIRTKQAALETMMQRLERARASVRSYIPEGRSLADELIAERRRAALDE